MRICYAVEGTVDVRMVEGLAERCELTVVGRDTDAGYTVTHPPACPVETRLGPQGRIAFARFLWACLQDRPRFDRVIVQGYGLSALAANLAARRTGVPTYMLVCSPVEAYYLCRRVAADPHKPFRRHELWLLKTVAALNARLGGRYIALSRYLADVVRGHGGRADVSVIPIYGVDTNTFVPSDRPKAQVRAQLGLPESGALIFFSSRVAPEKDSRTLLLAFQELRRRGRDAWLLNRSGGYKAILEEAALCGVGDRVIATDAAHPLRDLPLSYQAADLCIQASREEGLGFSPLEALACGVPVVAAAVGGLRETILDGRTGWTYPVGDWRALADRMEEALNGPAEADRRAGLGRDLVRAEYDARVAFDRLIAAMGRP